MSLIQCLVASLVLKWFAVFSNHSSFLTAFYVVDFPALCSSTQILCQPCIIRPAAESENSVIGVLGFFLMGAAVILDTSGLGNLAH